MESAVKQHQQVQRLLNREAEELLPGIAREGCEE
jgi:hypothetical protein